MDFSDFHGFFNALLSLFSLTDNSNKTIVDIIQDEWHIFKDKDVAKILLSDIISTSHLDYSIDTCVDYTNEIQDRVAVWDRLKNSVKENSRFFTNMDEFAQYEYLTAGKVYILVKNYIAPVLLRLVRKRLNGIKWDALQKN